MWRFLGLGLTALVIIIFGFSMVEVSSGTDVEASALLAAADVDYDGFARALSTEREWEFPRDHGPHPDYLTEWWYYTGNLEGEDGRRFGYQFTVFRRAIVPSEPELDSEWRTRQLYLAHFTVSDIEGGNFYHDARYSRGAAGLAGAEVDPTYRVWLEDWQVLALNDDATQLSMTAANDDIAIDFTLEHAKPPVLQGINGLSAKSSEEGNNSYYYTIPRMTTTGELTIEGETFTVTGNTWMDQEFSTSALPEGSQGWDWFGLIFEDNTEMMVGRIRMTEGENPDFGGLFVFEDASTVYLPADSFEITATDTWTSDFSGATYPVAWEIRVDGEILGQDEPLVIEVTALMPDQELHTSPTYWEGAVRIEGDKQGYGYAELTGYVEEMDGFF
jgi:predicted secreted hydrolase